MGTFTNTTLTSGLAPFEGAWDFSTAAHLLRRATFGPSKADILQAVEQGLEASLAALLAPQAAPTPPLYYNYALDPNAGLGESWAGKPYTLLAAERGPRTQSYRSWVIQQLMSDRSIREKMTFFWQNHFGVTYNGDAQERYLYNALLRREATGNFRQLLLEVTLRPAMLVFLNGNQNTANSPNENYGRELLELFTLGKGPQIGEGDYSHYTEQDVREISRALTGWRNRYFNSTVAGQLPEAFFQANRHDTGSKQLSYHFQHQVIENGGDQEYIQVIDIILAQPEVARHLCRKLYRFFVYYDITPQIESEIIEPLATLFRDSGYAIAPVLASLLGSQHFYDQRNRGSMIKSPLEFGLGITRAIGYEHLENVSLEAQYIFPLRLLGQFAIMGLDYHSPPSVAGWEAWYQTPAFNRSWINSSTLQARTRLVNQLLGAGFFAAGTRFQFDLVAWIAQLDNPTDPNALVAEISQLFLPKALEQVQLDALKDILIPGLPDFEWTDEYGLYLVEPNNTMLKNALQNKLSALFNAVLNLAEGHLC